MRISWSILKALPLGLVVPIVIGAASVKPEDAASNLSGWVRIMGVRNVPDWLAAPSIDKRVIIATIIIAVIYSSVIWGIPYFRKYRIGKDTTELSKKTKEPTSVPSLLSLFINDLQPPKGVKWGAFTDFELSGIEQKIRIFYNIFDDFNSNSKYMSFYVPSIFVRAGPYPPSQTMDIAKYIAEHYTQYINDVQEKRWIELNSVGDASVDSTKTIPFSGRIYLYHADNLDVEQLASLKKTFRDNGADIQFRGMDYAAAVWTSIQLGNVKAPPQYEMHDNLPRLVPDLSSTPPH